MRLTSEQRRILEMMGRGYELRVGFDRNWLQAPGKAEWLEWVSLADWRALHEAGLIRFVERKS